MLPEAGSRGASLLHTRAQALDRLTNKPVEPGVRVRHQDSGHHDNEPRFLDGPYRRVPSNRLWVVAVGLALSDLGRFVFKIKSS